MPLQLAGRSIHRVCIIDDDPAAREAYGWAVEDLRVSAATEASLLELKTPERFVQHVLHAEADAVLCDYHLRMRNYARFDGDELVVECYKAQLPAVLCTAYNDWDVTLMRSRRQFIPVLLQSADMNPDSLRQGFERCIEEFQGQFQPSREASRTLVRVEDASLDDGYFHVVVPGWNPRVKIRVLVDDLPGDVRKLVKPGNRFHARANVGCEKVEELYFCNWEPS